jgi:ribose 5-phosphate isomerase B
MNVYIGADHRGVEFKTRLVKLLDELGYKTFDCGTDSSETPFDYPKAAYKVASSVAKDKKSRGILVCMTGNGQVIAANKVTGAYAALCMNEELAMFARAHNNANIMVVSAKYVKENELKAMVKTFLSTEFEGGRHLRRFNQIKKIESGKKV